MFLGVALFAASYDSFQNLTSSYDRTATQFRFANLTVTGGDVSAFAAQASAEAGVDSVDTRTVLDIPIQVQGTKMLGRVVGLPAGSQPDVNQVKVLEGGYLDRGAPTGLLVEQHMADHFGLSSGDALSILGPSGWVDVTVQGTAASPEYIWPARSRQEVITTPDNFGVLFAPESLVRQLGDGPNEAVVYFDGGAPDPALESKLEGQAYASGAVGVLTREQQPSNAALEEDLSGFEEMALLFPVLFLAAASMAAYVTISRLVASQRPYIGVMAANGFTRGQILRHYLGYGLLPGLVGSVPGAVAGVLLARLITSLYTRLLAVPITVIDFYPATLAMAIVFGLVTSLAAALAPALVASRVQPAESMRGETPSGAGRPSLLERMIPPISRLPVRWRMALRSVGRNRKRTAYTVLGVVLSLMLVLVSWGMIDTIQNLLDKQYVTIQREDATVQFVQPVAPSDVAALTGVRGVSLVEPMLQAPVSLSSGTEHYETVLTVLEQDTAMHTFIDRDERQISLPADGILVGRALQDLIGVDVGSTVDMAIPDLGVTVEEKISGFLDEPLGTMAYVSWDGAESRLGATLPASSALIRYDDGADPAAVRAAITDRSDVAAFEDTKVLYNTMQNLMVLFYAFVGVMLAFGGAMAFALIFSSMSVNIAERSREMATLLAVGADRRSITTMVTVENLLVALPGIPIGLVAGYYLSRLAMSTFTSDLFSFDLYVRPWTFVWAALAIIVVALLSQIPGLRAIRRINIPQVVKERAA